MTHGDCASAGQRELDGVEKSNRAAGLAALTQIDALLMCCSLHCSGNVDAQVVLLRIHKEMEGSKKTYLSYQISSSACLYIIM